MTDVPIDAPVHCPGTQSTQAGQASACQGCPNQSMCSSGQAKVPLSEREPELVEGIRQRLAGISYCLLILSGKGGVGKSSFTTCLARGLCRRQRWWNSIGDNIENTSTGNIMGDNHDGHHRVGVLDLDLCGPSLPCLFGCIDQKVHQSHSGWSPVYVSDNLAVMSVGFLLPNPDQAIVWRGPRKNALIRQLLTDVCWREEEATGAGIDFLLVDTPPGTSDEHLSIVQYLQAAGCLTGAVVITTPQEVALSDVRKEINFCQKIGVPVIGIVENMTDFICPTCGHPGPVFPPTTGGAASLRTQVLSTENNALKGSGEDSTSTSSAVLGRLPLDPRLAHILDDGFCPFELADDNEENGSGGHLDNLSPSDAILVAYNDLIDTLLSTLRRDFQPLTAFT